MGLLLHTVRTNPDLWSQTPDAISFAQWGTWLHCSTFAR